MKIRYVETKVERKKSKFTFRKLFVSEWLKPVTCDGVKLVFFYYNLLFQG